MQGARPGRHEACEIRGAMGLEMPRAQRRPPFGASATG